jgi:hypothetical protein
MPTARAAVSVTRGLIWLLFSRNVIWTTVLISQSSTIRNECSVSVDTNTAHLELDAKPDKGTVKRQVEGEVVSL